MTIMKSHHYLPFKVLKKSHLTFCGTGDCISKGIKGQIPNHVLV